MRLGHSVSYKIAAEPDTEAFWAREERYACNWFYVRDRQRLEVALSLFCFMLRLYKSDRCLAKRQSHEAAALF